MPITTKELAELCHVSRGTVDRALNGRPGINSETRKRIQEAARQHKYRPHLIAASLSRGRSMSIGVVLFDLKNRYFSQMSNVISLSARNRGYLSYIAVTEKDIDTERQILHNLASRRVDGIILLPITRGREYVDQLKELEIPVVTIGNHLPGIHHAAIDEFKAAWDSARFIHQAGYRRICLICPPLRKKGAMGGKMNITSQELRAKGFKHYMTGNPELDYEILIDKDFCDSAASMVRSAASPGNRIAFLCSSDVYALELLKGFRERDISIPGDAGLMGFDNLDIFDYITPRITTVSTSLEKVGVQAISMLLKLIAHEKVPMVYHIPHEICPGQTL
jgi:LacI family transcriptional regulator